MTKRCSFVFGGQQYDEMVQCTRLEGNSMTTLVTLWLLRERHACN
jgi:hypothetical protein